MCRRSMLTVLLVAGLLAGCGRKANQEPVVTPLDPLPIQPTPPPSDPPVKEPTRVVLPPPTPPTPPSPAVDESHRWHDRAVSRLIEPSRKERYAAALLDAVSHIAEQKYNLALLDLQTAQGIDDTAEVRAEIARVTDLLAEQDAVANTVRDLQGVLQDGSPEEAVRLSHEAAKQFGGTDQGPALADLERQAEAVRLAGTAPDKRADLLPLAEKAKQENNLRVALVLFEAALADAPPDDPLRQSLEGVRARVLRYDEQRQRAERLRRDRATLADALPALQAAQAAWDTPQVRSDIDEVRFALAHSRDRLGVADFEVRGDLGVPGAGRTVADALLGGFKRRYDLVDRGQLDRVLGNLDLQGAALGDDAAARREVGRQGRLKYLVVGSITPLNGVTVHARLVNVESGLVEQTARLSAPTLDQLLNRLDVLAQLLQMTDEQRLALDAQVIEAAAPVPAIAPLAVNQIPPAPVVQPDQPPPPPLGAFAVAPVDLGAPVPVVVEDFRRLPAPVVLVSQPIFVMPLDLASDRRGRLLALSLALGDNLFRRGRHREAQRHYEVALTLAGNNPGVLIRLERCRTFLPPPPPPLIVVTPPLVVNPGPVQVVVNPPPLFFAPPPVYRPRVAVFGFVVRADAGLVPPALGDWTADAFAANLGPRYEVVDRGELYWTMGRLGLTTRDVLTDPGARWTLCQALQVRFLVFGVIEQTASFNVDTVLMDRTGVPTATAGIHVRSHEELKLRVGELTAQLSVPPAQAALLARQSRESEAALERVRVLRSERRFKEAAEVGQAALLKDPNSVALQTAVLQVTTQQQRAELAAQRQADAERTAEARKALRTEQAALVARSAAARQKAEAEAGNRPPALQERRKRAHDGFLEEGRQALARKAYPLAVQDFRCAVSLQPDPEGFTLLARAERERDLAHEVAVRDEAKKQAEVDARSRAEAVARLAEARKEQEAREAEHRRHDRDQAARLTEQARKDLAEGRADEALSAARTAQALHPTPEADLLVSEAEHARDLKLAREDSQRKEIETQQKRRQDYADAMKKGAEAMNARKYAEAVNQYDRATRLFRTDAAEGGLNGARALLKHEEAVQEAARTRAAEEERRKTEIVRLLATARQRSDARQYKEADADYDLVLRYDPSNVEARAGKAQVALARADYERRHAAEVEKARKQEQARVFVARGKEDLQAKRYEAALSALNEAVKLDPADAEAVALQKKAQDFRNAQARDEDAARKRKGDYDRLLAQGRQELGARNYAGAVKTLSEAQKLFPDNPEAASFLRQAQQGVKAKENEARVAELVADARKATGAKDFPRAEGLLKEARTLAPQDPEVSRATDELARARKPSPADLKRKEDYDLAMSAGDAAVKDKNYLGAFRAYHEAGRIVPGDAAAKAKEDAAAGIGYGIALTRGRSALDRKQADAALKDADEALTFKPADKDATTLRNAALALKTSPTPDAKKREEFNALVTRGREALKGKKPAEAIKDADEALKLFPGDKDATALKSEAQTLEAQMQAEAQARQRVTALVASGRMALVGKKPDEAIKNAEDALKLSPGDKDATALLNEARAAKTAMADAAKKAEYTRALTQGQQLLTAKKYVEAEKEFNQALALVPNDPTASKGLKEARDGQKPPANNPAEYARQFQLGQDADKQKRYTDAVTAYRKALEAMPGDPKAATALKTADFNQHLEAGKKHLAASRFPEAQTEFEAAVALFPANMEAKTLLQKAKDRKQ